VTLICSKSTNAIPWENLSITVTNNIPKDDGQTVSAVSPLIVVRQSTLMTMFLFVKMKGGNFITGPSYVSNIIIEIV